MIPAAGMTPTMLQGLRGRLCLCFCAIENGVQQHVAAGGQVLGLASSISLWLMPPTQGTKIIAVGATRAM